MRYPRVVYTPYAEGGFKLDAEPREFRSKVLLSSIEIGYSVSFFRV